MKTWITFFFLISPMFIFSQNGVVNGGDLVKQVGDYNETSIVQIVTGGRLNQHFAEVEQYGYNNQSEVIQKGGATIGQIHHVFIQQDGDANKAFIEQFDNENTAKISQFGESNLFKLKQSGNQNTFGKNTFIQNGNSNKFAGVFTREGLSFNETGYAFQENGATIDIMSFQIGNNNVVGLSQGAGDIGLIQQFGNGNEILLWQGGHGDYAQIKQFGSGNSVKLLQH